MVFLLSCLSLTFDTGPGTVPIRRELSDCQLRFYPLKQACYMLFQFPLLNGQTNLWWTQDS